MGSYYYLYNKKCPHCGEENDEIIFAANSYDKDGNDRGFDTDRCDKCGETIRIDMEFVLSKYVEDSDERI